MWAQEWNNIIDLVIPYPRATSMNVTKALLDAGYAPMSMFRLAEQFFTSIGLEPMTSDFWNKSIIVRPDDNTPMQCHASADDFYSQTDFRCVINYNC